MTEKRNLPQGETPDQTRDRIAPEPEPEAPPAPQAVSFRIRALIEELRGPDGRGANREISIAITEIETGVLWLERNGL